MIYLIICVLVTISAVVVFYYGYKMAIRIQELEEDIECQEFLMNRIWLYLNNDDNDGARELLASYFRNQRNDVDCQWK